MSVTASDSLMNEQSTTITTTTGVSISMTAGFMLIGPMATVSTGFNTDWSNAVTNAFAETTSNSVTKSLTLNIGLTPGANFNGTSNNKDYRQCADMNSLVHSYLDLPVIYNELQWCGSIVREVYAKP